MPLDRTTAPPVARADRRVGAAIRARLSEDGRLTCAAAFDAARTENVPPRLIGQTADALGVRLSRCQLGLFGYPGKSKGWTADEAEAPFPAGCEAALRSLGGSPACPELWALAEAFAASRLQVGRFADRLGLKVVGCPLGAF
jgi:hypothetical protein